GDVPTWQVRSGEFKREIRTEGVLQAAQATLLGAPTEARGQLKIAWLAPDSSFVHQGDVVIRFDPSDWEKERSAGRYDRAAAESKMEQKNVRSEGSLRNLQRDADLAELELRYAKEFQSKDPLIFSRNDIVQSEIDQTLAGERRDFSQRTQKIQSELSRDELALLAIERRKAQLKIEQAERALGALEVRAPHDGIFVLRDLWGRMPEVGAVVWRGNPLAEIPQPEVMEAKVYVLEADAGGLQPGAPATVRLDAHPDRLYAGKIKSVDALAQPKESWLPVQYFGVVLELETTDRERMKPGARLTATLVLEARSDVLTVPRGAVQQLEGKPVVYVRRSSGYEPAAVELGPSALGRVVVERGLAAGDVVALRDPTQPLSAPAARPAEESPASGPSPRIAS
ncbi:MAG TPA: HlyD family efflux transporter periplasmic adaptor subunit, partial [Candidatus Polarisedimenticolaceae bacterium]|nr:HlyD family efflux transporter periplasmic adaptor subunit [Candidatus Polarisedimenticolaceae bacterium]